MSSLHPCSDAATGCADLPLRALLGCPNQHRGDPGHGHVGVAKTENLGPGPEAAFPGQDRMWRFGITEKPLAKKLVLPRRVIAGFLPTLFIMMG